MSASSLGRVGGQLAESLAWLNSPAAIAGELRRLEGLQGAGESTEVTRALLADWRAVRAAQAALVQRDDETDAATYEQGGTPNG